VLADAAAAHELIESSAHIGKIVLEVVSEKVKARTLMLPSPKPFRIQKKTT
jgi:hypothetical protein